MVQLGLPLTTHVSTALLVLLLLVENCQIAAACSLIQLFGPWEIQLLYQICNFQTHMRDRQFLWNCLQVNATRLHWSLANIASSNDLVPSGNKPNEPYMSQCCPRSISPYGSNRWQWIKPIKQCKEPLMPHIVIFLWNEVADQWILHTDGQ